MALDPNSDLALETPAETRETATDVLDADDLKSVQADAAALSKERADFLKESYHRPRSKSGEIASRALLELFDGAKKILGYSTGERPKVTLPGEDTVRSLLGEDETSSIAEAVGEGNVANNIEGGVTAGKHSGNKTADAPGDRADRPAQPSDQLAQHHDSVRPASDAPAGDHVEKWGRREVLVHQDGTAEYTVKKGDTIWGVARDVLKQRHPGSNPTGPETLAEVNRIAKDSGIRDPNQINIGDKLTIKSTAHKKDGDKPADGPSDKPPEKPADKPADKPAENPVPAEPTRIDNFYPEDGAYNPIASPGIGDSPAGESWDDERDMGGDNTDIDWRKTVKEEAADGTVTYRYTGELDGAVTDTNFSGSEKWKDGRLLERHASYEDGEDITFKTPGGKTQEIENVTNVDTTYNPKTGNYDTIITTEDGKKYRAETAPDGTVKSFRDATEKFGEPKHTDAPSDAKPSDRPADKPADKPTDKPADKPAELTEDQKKACAAKADAIEKACNGGTGIGTDKDVIFTLLKDTTEAERKEIDRVFREKYGKNYGEKGDGSDWGLEDELRDELSGADLDKALNMLNRKDGDADRAGRIHEALTELDQAVEGRSDATCEKDIRETLATMNSDQIEKLKADYKERYGKSLEDALQDDPNLSAETKEALKIYMKGADKRTDEDTLKLADLALKAENIDMFQEAMSKASPAAREKFMTDDGQKKVEDAFWGADERHALEYAKDGKLSTTTMLKDNQSWAGDNEKAIEDAISKMSPEERKSYLRGKELADGKTPESELTDEQKKDLAKYKEIRAELEDAGNETEIARWEDMIANKDGSIVSKLAAHRGSIYDDSMDDVLNDIENMSKKDWEQLKKDPNFRSEIEKTLKTYLSDDDVKRCMEVVDKKAAAEKFEDAQSAGRRPILDAISDASGTFDDTETNIYNAIKNMSPEEQKKYREDPTFRKEVDDKIKSVLDEGPEQDAAFKMLKQIEKGEKPTEDIVTKILMEAGKSNTDEGKVLRDMQQAFRESEEKGEKPTLRERINNPQSEEDRRFSEAFKEAVNKALENDDDHKKWAEQLLRDGYLPVDVQMELAKGLTDDDEQAAYKDLTALGERANKYPKSEAEAEADANAAAKAKGKDKADPADVEAAKAKARDEMKSFEERLAKGDPDAKSIKAAREERDKLLTDKEYQDKALGFLSDEERAVALNAVKQGEMRPEDKIRSHMLGAGTGEEEIKEVLNGLSPAEREHVKAEYLRKYGSDLTYDLLDELGGQDAVDAKRKILREPTSSEEAFDRARDEYYESRDGFGSAWTDAMWDGTGYQTDEAYLAFSKAMADSAAKFEELPPDKQKELMENLQKQLDQFRESKMAVADGLTDAGIAVGCLALAVGGVFTEGGTWVVLGALIAGGTLKMGAKGAIMGADYDWSSSQALVDFAAGGVDAALNVVTFGAGGVAAESVLKAGGKALIREGAEEVLEKGMKAIIRESLENGIKKGSAEFSEKSIKELVEKLAKEGVDKAQLEKLIREGLDKGVKEASESLIKTMALRAAEGSVGGGGSGGVRALAEWDTNKSFAENMAMVGKAVGTGAAFGAAGAAGTAVVFKVGGKAYHAIKEHYNLKPGETPSPETLKAIEKDIEKAGGKDVDVRVSKNGDIEAVPAKSEAVPAKSNDAPPTGPHDAPPVVPRDVPPTATDFPASKFPEKTDQFGKYVEYPVGEGKSIKLRERDGWYYPDKLAGGGDVDRAVKIHVLADNPADMGKLQKILLEEMAKDPELAKMIPELKMQDPRLADPAFAEKAGVKVGSGQEQKAFTIGVHSPEDAIKLQKKLDEILAKHPELKLDKPITPDGLDRLAGESGRVGIVRDFYPQGVDASGAPGARLDKDLADRIHADKSLDKDASGKLTEGSLRKVEDSAGLKRGSLTYDTEGNLMLKASDSPVDAGKIADFAKNRANVGEPAEGGRYSAEQLRKMESVAKLKEGTFYYNEDGVLMQKTAPSRDGNVYLKERDATKVPKGELDPRTGKPSEGLEDRFAYYKLADKYGVDPVEAIAFKPGESVKVSGKDAEVIGREGDNIIVRPKDAPPVEGERIKVTPEQLKSDYQKIGDGDYYVKDGLYYKAVDDGQGGKALIEDWDAVSVRPQNITRVADEPVPPTRPSAGDSHTDTNPKREKVGDDRPPPAPKHGPVEPGFKDTGLTDADGNRIIYRAGSHDVPGKGPVEIDPAHPPEGMTPIKIGNTAAYRDADGNVYRMYRINETTHAKGTYVPDGNYKVEMSDRTPPTLRSGQLADRPAVRFDEPTTVRYDEPTTVRYEDPTTVRYDDPTTVRYEDPTTVRYEDPATVRYDEPATVKYDGPSTVKYDEPTTVRYDEPTTVRYDDPVTVRYEAGTTVTVDGPEGPKTIRYDEPTTVRYDEPTTVRYDGPTTVRQDGPATVRYDEPTTVRYDEPTTVRYDEPVTVRYEDPVTVRYDDPVTVRIDDPTTVRYDDPTTVRYDDPTTVRFDDPTQVRVDDPKRVTTEIDPETGEPITLRSIDEGPESRLDRRPDTRAKSEALPREAVDDPTMNWAEIPPEKRLEMVNRAKRSELYQTEAVDDFVARAQEVTAKWDDQSQVTRNFEKSHENLVGSYARYKAGVEEPLSAALAKLGKSSDEIKALLKNSDEVRKLLQNEDVVKLLDSEDMRKSFPSAAKPDERLKVVDDVVDARKGFADQQQIMDKVVKERTTQIQELMDKYADDHGLPRVKVRLADEVGANGTYRPGEGLLSINQSDVLAAKDPSKLIDTMYHEFAHAEQDSLVIRHLLDRGFIDTFPPTAQDLDFLKTTYEGETGRPLSDEHLKRVLEAARDPENPQQFKPLSEADTARAAELIADQQKHPWPGEKVTEWKNDIRVARSELTKLNADPNESMRLIDALSKTNGDSKALSKRLFGSENPPPEIQHLIDTFKDPSKTFDTDIARRVLKGRIEEGIGENEALIKSAWQDYFDNPDEQEAWLIGKRAGIAARESGSPGIDDEPTLVKDINPHPERTMRTTQPGIGNTSRPGDTLPGVGPRTERPADTLPGIGTVGAKTSPSAELAPDAPARLGDQRTPQQDLLETPEEAALSAELLSFLDEIAGR